MSEKILSITIDGESYRKYKTAYEATKKNLQAINFGGGSFYSYEWNFYTKDEVLKEMAKQYQFMCDKFVEQKQREISLLKKEVERLTNINKVEKL